MAKRTERGGGVTLPDAVCRVLLEGDSPDNCCIRFVRPDNYSGGGSEEDEKRWFDGVEKQLGELVVQRFAQIGLRVRIQSSYHKFVKQGEKWVVYFIINPITV